MKFRPANAPWYQSSKRIHIIPRVPTLIYMSILDHCPFESITWDNFDEGAWPEEVRSLNAYRLMTSFKRHIKKGLRTARLSSTQHPKREPCTFWKTYFEAEANFIREYDEFYELITNVDTLVRVLASAPFYTSSYNLQTSLSHLSVINYPLLALIVDLERARRLLRSFQTMPAHAEALLRYDYGYELYKLMEPKINSHFAASKEVASTSEHTVDNSSAEAKAIIPSKAFYDRASEESKFAFNKQPEPWTIEPTYSVFTHSVLKIRSFPRLVARSSSRLVNQLKKINAVYRSYRVTLESIGQLSQELCALQHYRLERFPGSMVGPLIKLGWWIWDRVEAQRRLYYYQ
jgi:hypothetical protein